MSAWQAPENSEQAALRLHQAGVDAPILEILRDLKRAGYAAALVGGAVRDVLCGRGRGDWDVATSATPQQVQALFRRTIPTGLAHGTVTVLVGKGKPLAVEVTTFRGEGAYHDGRRPSEVYYLQDLREDLARRDFTINACAWDPIDQVFSDPFGGLQDLQGRRIRAVGDPLARFREDGLRTMRALRFAAVLECSIDEATLAAMGQALDVFAKVARERVRVEAFKLLDAARPSLGLLPMDTVGLWPLVFGQHEPGQRPNLARQVDGLPARALLRLTSLLRALPDPSTREAVLMELKPSRQERDYALDLARADLAALTQVREAREVRRLVAGIGRTRLADALILAQADEAAQKRVHAACDGAALTIGELAIGAQALIEAGIARPGPALGQVLQTLLVSVLDEPSRNTPAQLLAIAAQSL